MKVKEETEDSVTIELDMDVHLWIETPRGRVKVFVGDNWSMITSWINDTDYAGFYTNNATKKTHACNEEVQQIELRSKV